MQAWSACFGGGKVYPNTSKKAVPPDLGMVVFLCAVFLKYERWGCHFL